MPFYRDPDSGTVMHLNFGRRRGPAACQFCGWISGFQCDFPVGKGTCDKFMCDRCATETGRNTHVCPHHKQQGELFK